MLQLHRRGKIEEEQLQQAARAYLWIYAKNGTALVPFKDVAAGKIRYVKFTQLPGVEGWVFTDLVD